MNYKYVLSSAPLDQTGKVLKDCPAEINMSSEKLNCSSLSLYTIEFTREKEIPCHWGYVYDHDIPFARYYYPKTLLNDFASETQFVQAEVYHSKYLPKDLAYDCEENVILGFEKIGAFSKSNVKAVDVRSTKYANVIFDHDRVGNRDKVFDYLVSKDIYPIGRFGSWRYLWSDQSYLDGRNTAAQLKL